MDFSFTAVLGKILGESGYAGLFGNGAEGLKCLVMILIAFVLLYLGIAKKFEPLLLVTIPTWFPMWKMTVCCTGCIPA